MNAHSKAHKNVDCEKCGKSFKYLELLKIHTKVSHEKSKMYCHYFNNRKACPFKEECLFLHEDSEMCKYGKLCERMLCMFKHEENEENCENVENVITKLQDIRTINMNKSYGNKT